MENTWERALSLRERGRGEREREGKRERKGKREKERMCPDKSNVSAVKQ